MVPTSEFFTRTMHTPDDPARAARRATLREISRLLLPLHRALIEGARADFAFAYEAVDRPSQLLSLLNEHPFFAWLKPMTSLIVMNPSGTGPRYACPGRRLCQFGVRRRSESQRSRRQELATSPRSSTT